MGTLNQLSIGLFDPGMTHIHRIGLAGLYMSLKNLGTSGSTFQGMDYKMAMDHVALTWSGTEPFDKLLNTAFGITQTQPSGLIDFAAHRGLAIGDLQRIELTRAVLGSYLQHNKQNKIPKGTATRSLSLPLGDDQVFIEYRPLVKPYAHSEGANWMLKKKGNPKEIVSIKGWLYPGAAERHVALSGTKMEEPPEKCLCLLFAPVASLYYRLSHRRSDGKFDKRRGTAVCFPHITDLESYSRCYGRYLQSPVERLSADGLGDAGLSALVALKAGDSLEHLGLIGCTVVTMGTVGWYKQQMTRTGVAVLEEVREEVLNHFDLACRCLPNRVQITLGDQSKKGRNAEQRYFVVTSLARGLIAENIAAGREWFRGFAQLMCSKEQARIISFEKGGLKEMVDKTPWPHEADKHFVEAIHAAVGNRYGALAAQAKNRGEAIPFDREFERMRTGLMRAKNAQSLRAELADLFARGGLNKILQKQWPQLLPLFTGSDWQRSRDLALLGLASYEGKGA